MSFAVSYFTFPMLKSAPLVKRVSTQIETAIIEMTNRV